METKIWEYGFTTPDVSSTNDSGEDKSIFSDMMENRSTGALYGWVAEILIILELLDILRIKTWIYVIRDCADIVFSWSCMI